MKTFWLILLLLASTALVGCGGKQSAIGATGTTTPKQLDPQGNWLFVVTSSDGTQTVTWARLEAHVPRKSRRPTAYPAFLA